MPSLYLPTLPTPVSYRIRSNYRTQTSMSVSGKIVSRKYGGQYYEMTLVYPPMRRDQAAPIIAFLEEQEGQLGIFRVELPDDMSGTAGLEVGNFANIVGDASNKLYRIVEAGASPKLMPSVTGATPITTGVMMRCSLKNDVQVITLGPSGLIRLEIDLVERVV